MQPPHLSAYTARIFLFHMLSTVYNVLALVQSLKYVKARRDRTGQKIEFSAALPSYTKSGWIVWEGWAVFRPWGTGGHHGGTVARPVPARLTLGEARERGPGWSCAPQGPVRLLIHDRPRRIWGRGGCRHTLEPDARLALSDIHPLRYVDSLTSVTVIKRFPRYWTLDPPIVPAILP
jgi:hypothetical protein